MARGECGRLIQEEKVRVRLRLHEVIRILERPCDAVDPVLVIVLLRYLTVFVDRPAVTALREGALTKGHESFWVHDRDIHA